MAVFFGSKEQKCMLIRLQRTFNNIQGSLWFVPSVIVVVLMALAFVMVWLDRSVGYDAATHLPLVFERGPEGTRDMLATIAGSMLTVASVAFSFTIVVFSFASSQYASRTLHSFMDDNTNQSVLGMLLGSFVYCLLVLRTVRTESGQEFVPVISSSVALLLAVVDLLLFIVFIHHVSESIQAYHIIQRVGIATCRTISALYPEHARGRQHEEETEALVTGMKTREVRSLQTGYIQMVFADHLVKLATRLDLVVLLQKSVGKFVVDNEVLATVGPSERVTDEVVRQVRETFASGPHRTIYQDPLYGVLQLSDIAIKALSPAINDPNTAVMALNEISKVLRQLAGRDLPKHILTDMQGKPRVIADSVTFDSMAAQAFDQIRRYGMGDAIIPAKMLDVIAEIGEETDLESERTTLREHVRAIMEDADRLIIDLRDRAQINAEFPAVARVLGIREGEVRML
jgi:uncharacterized membrane protein